MALPVEFLHANTNFIAPGCLDLPGCVTHDTTGQPLIVTCWQLTDEEKQRVAETGQVYLSVIGTGQPPVYVSSLSPFEEQPAPEDGHSLRHAMSHILSVIYTLLKDEPDPVVTGNRLTDLHDYLSGAMTQIAAKLGVRACYGVGRQLRFRPLTPQEIETSKLESALRVVVPSANN